MMREKALQWIIETEGGYVNNPKDSGGETKYGISKKSYPRLGIKNLTESHAKYIYIRDFWNKILGDDLPDPMNLCVFDMAVNAGVKTAVILLQKAVGARQDGIAGPQTLEHVYGFQDAFTYNDYLWIRAEYYTECRKAEYFLKGWINRLIKLRKFIDENRYS